MVYGIDERVQQWSDCSGQHGDGFLDNERRALVARPQIDKKDCPMQDGEHHKVRGVGGEEGFSLSADRRDVENCGDDENIKDQSGGVEKSRQQQWLPGSLRLQ